MKALNDAALRGFGGQAASLGRSPVSTMGALRRYTLVLLRWGAVLGQTLALLIVSQVLGYDYPIWECALVIAASVVVNLVVTFSWSLDRRVSDMEAGFQLGYDLIQLAALLYLTGGITNPFSILFLAPVVTSATTLSRPVTFSLGFIAFALSLILVFYHRPLPWNPAGSFELPLVFNLGIWTAITTGSVFTSLYAWRTTKESRKMSVALAAAESMLAQEQKMSALGGLAAAAAHELGTPLATIQVVAKEMSLELDAKSPLGEDAALVLSQAKRCREILAQLSERGDAGDLVHDALSLEDLLEESSDTHLGADKQIIIITEGDVPQPRIMRQPELLYALKNYIENAVDFAQSRVELTAHWTDEIITLEIDDDGPGFDPTLKGRLGQPYASTRLKGRDANAGGLGLGVFISATLIERTGGRVRYGTSPLGGAQVTIVWPAALLLST